MSQADSHPVTFRGVYSCKRLGNFSLGNGGQYSNIGASFGQVTGANRDISGTVEPGGRILEFMLRLNF